MIVRIQSLDVLVLVGEVQHGRVPAPGSDDGLLIKVKYNPVSWKVLNTKPLSASTGWQGWCTCGAWLNTKLLTRLARRAEATPCPETS